MSIGEKIKRIRLDKKISTYKLSEITGISQPTISKLENGKRSPDADLIKTIASALEVPIGLIIEDENVINKIAEEQSKYTTFNNMDLNEEEKVAYLKDTLKELPEIFNDLPMKKRNELLSGETPNSFYTPVGQMTSIPVLGVIRAGEPIRAEQNIIGYEYLPSEMIKGSDCFGLKVTGDSMNNSRIMDGDIVLVREQPEVDNGDIAVVLVNGDEATIKKFYRTENTITLLPNSLNPTYQPIIIDPQKTPVKVLGKVIKVIMEV